MSKRWIAVLFILAVAPSAAAAQFTTFLTPKNPVKDSIKAAVVAEQKAVNDSVTRAQIANMKTWVDSAAGIVVPPVDTMIAVQTISGDTVMVRTPVTTVASDGMVAPNTASPVPFLLATGILGMLLGLMMVRRPRAKPRRIDGR